MHIRGSTQFRSEEILAIAMSLASSLMPTPIQHVPGTGQIVLWFHPKISAFLVLGCG